MSDLLDPVSDLPILAPETEPEAEEESTGEEPRTILITGAAGNLGRKLRAAWEDHYNLILLDVNDDDPDVIAADLATWDEEWACLFDEADTVVHLAANPSEFATWPELVGPNVDALANVLLASAQAGVDRVIYASSNHAMGGYRTDGSTHPIAVDLPPKPGNDYGAAKLMGERLGRSFAAAFGLTFVGLRIGWTRAGENLAETLHTETGDITIWLSNADLVRLFTAAVEAELAEGSFVVVNGTSINRGGRWTLDEARDLIGFEPQDSRG